MKKKEEIQLLKASVRLGQAKVIALECQLDIAVIQENKYRQLDNMQRLEISRLREQLAQSDKLIEELKQNNFSTIIDLIKHAPITEEERYKFLKILGK